MSSTATLRAIMAVKVPRAARPWPLIAGLLFVTCAAILAVVLERGDGVVRATTTVPVSAFPAPGSAVVSPKTQVSLRGAPHSELGSVRVRGSESGRHAGRMHEHPDGRGASFAPDEPFKPGEKVTVETSLHIR